MMENAHAAGGTLPVSEVVLILMLLLAIGMIAAALFRRLPIPYTVMLVVIGMALEEQAGVWETLAPLKNFQLTPELVLFIFLPTLIFESGFNLNARQLIKDIAPVLALAVPALLFSTFVVGMGVWLVLPVSLGVALVFGALISATDPVAVVALFKELGIPERLTVLVEGESLLNDATAIVIFNILLGIVLYGGMTWGDAGLAVGEFFKVFFGGAMVGILFGFLFSWLMGRMHSATSAILILSLVMAYTSFIIAEHTLRLSGVMAVVGAAVTLGVFGMPRLPREAGTALGEAWEFLAMICNTLLFLLVGLSVDIGSLIGRLDTILVAVLLLMAARASMIYSLVPLATRTFGLPRITLGERHIMWWGGLKGGLAIAIVLSIPEDMAGRQLLLDLTLGVVLFTLLVNAPTIRPLIARLGLDQLTDDEKADLKRGMDVALNCADESLERFRKFGLLSRASHHRASGKLHELLPEEQHEMTAEHSYRRSRINGLRAEQETLENLYKAEVIPHYTFLDLRGELVRARDHLLEPERHTGHTKRQSNPFLRLEDALIRRLREQDWAAGLLSRYQNRRMSHHLIKDIARTLMTESALESLQHEHALTPEQRERLDGRYRERLGWFRDSIEEIRRDFPDFYEGFESRLSMRTALARALLEVDEASRQGSLGAKPQTLMERRIHQAIAEIPPPSAAKPDINALELVSMVPLLSGLPPASIEGIAAQAKPVHYLTDDTIIGEGEHGDALYIVARGRVSVSRQNSDGEEKVLGELDAGDFFGETALLGEHVRTATVRATQSCTLLRLTCKDVLAMAKNHPEISLRLKEAQQARVKDNDS